MFGRYTTSPAKIIEVDKPPLCTPFDSSKWDLRFMTPLDPSVLDSGAKAHGT